MHFLGKKYYKPNVSALEINLESNILDGSITNAPMTVNKVEVDAFENGGGVTFYFDEDRIEY